MSTNIQLGTCLISLQRYSEAEPILLKAVAILESSRGANSERTQDGYRALRDLYANTGQAQQAARWQSKILPINAVR